MTKSIQHFVGFLLLLLISGGCNQSNTAMSTAEQAELEEIYRRFGSNDISARESFGQSTLLHYAATQSSPAVVRYLVSKGASLHAKNFASQTPLHSAVASNENLEVTKFLLSRQEGGMDYTNNPFTLLHLAASNKNVEVIKFIASKGQEGNVNAKDADGSTPLHWAASNTNVEVAKFLVSLGADPKIRNKDGKTPLDKAREWMRTWASTEHTEMANPEVEKYLSSIR